MAYTPRTIAFICELLHPPRKPDAALIQKLHNEMFQGEHPLYASFAVTPQGAVLSNQPVTAGAVSSVSFLADRMLFREELGGATCETFAQSVHQMVELAARFLGPQLYPLQRVTVRSLVNPRRFKDSRSFLKEGLFGFSKETEVLGREPGFYGIKLAFPVSADEPLFSVRIESFNSDPRSIFLENQGTFRPSAGASGSEALTANIHSTYEFMVERVLPFVHAFDRQEA